ncbi:hypothetical protein MP228_009502 [Amoeboaphelidium protococcarum]|nr:hypothetical protein MP228_009502 [Amoeboaphelidium protococcarum]
MVYYVNIICLVSSFLVIHVASAVSSEFQEILNLVNAERASKGAPAVCLNAKLNQVAQRYAQVLDAAGAMGHEGVDGTDLPMRLQAAGFPYSSAGEILAKCSKPQDAVRGWIASPSHHSAMIDPRYQLAGIGQSGQKWAMYFAASGEEKCSSDEQDPSPSSTTEPSSSLANAPTAEPASSFNAPAAEDQAASQKETSLDLSNDINFDAVSSVINSILPGLTESTEKVNELCQLLARFGIGKGGTSCMSG